MLRRSPLLKIMESELPDFARCKKGYQPTLKEAKHYYKLINRHVFENQLTPTKIRIFRMRDCWGYCSNINNNSSEPISEILLTRKFPCLQFFIAVLAHEMVHQFQWEIETPLRRSRGLGPVWGHGANFFRWSRKFKRVGIPLSRYGNHHKLIEHRDIWAMSR